MERWEYQVIHLNIEPPAPVPPPAPPAAAPGGEPAPGAPSSRGEPFFSRAYLEKEFPGFYGGPPQAGTPAQEHPANQLRGFLNLQGRDGWQLVGFYPVGQLTMMIFRRLLAMAEAEQTARPPGDPGPAVAADHAGAAASAPCGEPPGAQAAVLEGILRRLEALERQPPSPLSVVAGAQPPPAGQAWPEPAGLATVRDGEILSSQQLGDLESLPRLSTSEAARALGFRSAGSLLNLAGRSGYPPGLVKRGADAALAVYVGSEKNGRGGRDRRLWVVLRAPAA
jgi:hypothetical protein